MQYWNGRKEVQEIKLTAFRRQLRFVQELAGQLGRTEAIKIEQRMCKTQIAFIETDLLETERELNKLTSEWFEVSSGQA